MTICPGCATLDSRREARLTVDPNTVLHLGAIVRRVQAVTLSVPAAEVETVAAKLTADSDDTALAHRAGETLGLDLAPGKIAVLVGHLIGGDRLAVQRGSGGNLAGELQLGRRHNGLLLVG